jgi:hypothetical protein
MKTRNINGIPAIDDIQDLDDSTLKEFLTLGVCYVNKNLVPKVPLLVDELNLNAANFFSKSAIEKKMCVAYNDRRTSEVKELSERLSFPACQPPEELKAVQPSINEARVELQQNIVIPLLLRIFEYYKITMDDKFLDEDGTYLSFVNYPVSAGIGKLGLTKHKDIGLLTVLALNEAGLKCRDNKELNTWKDIVVNPAYYVVMCGKALQLILGKDKCHSPSHYVEIKDEKRLTMGMFYNPQAKEPVVNIFTRQEIFKNFFPDYASTMFAKYK